jgi:alpha-beta hydrolase superfamily lysophospholipase
MKITMEQIRVVPTQFESEGELIRGNFVLPERTGSFPGICKFHGLPGSSDQVHGVASILAEAGFAVLTFDFRGFRRSEGIFRLSGQITDAMNAIKYLQDAEFSREDWVGIYGASYGAAIAINVASRDSRIDALCIRAPVYDTLAFARSPFIRPEVERLVKESPDEVHGLANPDLRKQILDWMKEDGEKYNPLEVISKMPPRPFLVISGDADIAIDVPGVKHLFDLAPEPKKIIIVEGADHELSDSSAYEITLKHIINWFNEHKPMDRL